MEKEVIYDDQAGEHVVGTATTWNEAHEVCAQCGLRVEPIGSEGPKAFYIRAAQKHVRDGKS